MRYFTDFTRWPALLGLAVLAAPPAARAQALTNYGTSLIIGAGASVYVQGDFLNAAGSTFTNADTLRVSGNTTANAAASSAGGTLVLAGSSPQALGGTADYAATDVVLNNAAGLTLATRLRLYRAKRFNHDTERVQYLFERYAEFSAPLAPAPKAPAKPRKLRPAASGPA